MLFESPQGRALAVSNDGLRLVALNTPDRRVALFSLASPERPVLLREIPVALEPTAVAFASANEAWVVCHLADAVCVVDLAAGVVRDTLFVGDEPGDVVIAGGRAFVPSATRRELVVFDVASRARIASVPLSCDEPRRMARSPDGTRLWLAAHRSGNDTTLVAASHAPPQPAPSNPLLPPPPDVGLIVHSEDPAWSGVHGVVLPDHDVFEINTGSLAIVRQHAGVGTILFGLDVRPTDGSVWVANTEARNLVRFEPALRGHVVDNRVTRIAGGSSPTVTAFDLNAGIDYATLPDPSATATALAQPTDVAFAPNGEHLYVAAFGTDRLGVVDPDTGVVLARIALGGGATTREKRGPRALAVSSDGAWLYVLHRLKNSLSVVDTAARQEVGEYSLVHDPTPTAWKQGRGFLYDALLSGNGTASCASCHVDAGTDGLAWDLGDPGGAMRTVPTSLGNESVHPMKGPMLTQTLAGLGGTGLLHWRGDQPDLAAFNDSFATLLGGAPLAAPDLASFAAFVDAIALPPNPNQNLDRTFAATPVGASAAEGRVLFEQQPFFFGFVRCVDCHAANATMFGPVVNATTLMTSQPFAIPRLGDVYKRTGKRLASGARTSGFGLLHDGEADDTFGLLTLTQEPVATDPIAKAKLQAYVDAFDTGTAPAVGHAVTMDANDAASQAALADCALLIGRAHAGDCGLIAFGVVDGTARGFAYDATAARFVTDRGHEPPLAASDLLLLVLQGRVTLTLLGVPPGAQSRGIDRDHDGIRDGDEAPVAYGAGTLGCAHVLRTSSPAFAGNDQFGLVIDHAAAGAPGVLVIAPLAGSATVLGVEVLVDPMSAALLPVVADARGVAVRALPLPDDPSLRGLWLCVQAVFADACGPAGLAATAGLRLQID